MRAPKADDSKPINVINFSDDNDGAPDSEGEYTSATLTKPGMPQDFTICTAFLAEAWNSKFTGTFVFTLNDPRGIAWAYVLVYASELNTEYRVMLARHQFSVFINRPLFPMTWTRLCVSYDTATSKKVLVVDGQHYEKPVSHDLRRDWRFEANEYQPNNLSITLAEYRTLEWTGSISNVNIFSSLQSTEMMINMTTTGRECGAPGDYLSWEEADWRLHAMAKIEMVSVESGPCHRESAINVFMAHFTTIRQCVYHCGTVGNDTHGRIPPVRSLQEWNWLKAELAAISPDIQNKRNLWLSATDAREEEVWRDLYTNELLQTNWTWPWRNTGSRNVKTDDTKDILSTEGSKYWQETGASSVDFASGLQKYFICPFLDIFETHHSY